MCKKKHVLRKRVLFITLWNKKVAQKQHVKWSDAEMADVDSASDSSEEYAHSQPLKV